MDEDPNRAGGMHMGKPVFHPKDVPDGAAVFLGLGHKQAEQIARRIERPQIVLTLPPPPGID